MALSFRSPRTAWPVYLSLFTLLTTGCGGGSSGYELPSNPSNTNNNGGGNGNTQSSTAGLSPEQQAFEKAFLTSDAERTHAILWYLPWNPANLKSNTYELYGKTFSISASPTKGPQPLVESAPIPMTQTINLLPQKPEAKSGVVWTVDNNSIIDAGDAARAFSYEGNNVIAQDYIRDTRVNIRRLRLQVTEYPLTGTVGNAPAELKNSLYVPFYQDGYLRPEQTFAPGAIAYRLAYHAAEDVVEIYDCTKAPDGAPATTMPRPCENRPPLQQALSTAGIKVNNGRVWKWDEGRSLTWRGHHAWVSYGPVSPPREPASWHRMFIEINGSIYLAAMTPAGTLFYSQSYRTSPEVKDEDQQYQGFVTRLNRPAFDSLKAAVKF